MNKISGVFGKWSWMIAGLFVVTGCIFLFLSLDHSVSSINGEQEQQTQTIQSTLNIAAQDFNNVLPQRIGSNTYFDSVRVGQNQLWYYYSLSDLTQSDFLNRQLHDSVYAEAVNRIPCTLWRPVYMQGVEVTFTYYSSDEKELVHFSRLQDACN